MKNQFICIKNFVSIFDHSVHKHALYCQYINKT